MPLKSGASHIFITFVVDLLHQNFSHNVYILGNLGLNKESIEESGSFVETLNSVITDGFDTESTRSYILAKAREFKENLDALVVKIGDVDTADFADISQLDEVEAIGVVLNTDADNLD